MGLVIKRAAEVEAEALAATERAIAAAADARVEEQAQALGYNSSAHLAGYFNSTRQDWAAEAAAFIAWRDLVWVTVFAVRADSIASGKVPTLDDVLAALPKWPHKS